MPKRGRTVSDEDGKLSPVVTRARDERWSYPKQPEKIQINCQQSNGRQFDVDERDNKYTRVPDSGGGRCVRSDSIIILPDLPGWIWWMRTEDKQIIDPGAYYYLTSP